jgi:hypothetical protein
MNYQDMNGKELVEAYNAILTKLGKPPIKEFRSKTDGIERITKLAAEVNGHTMRTGEAEGTGDLPEDPQEAKDQLQREFGDPDSPPPQDAPAQADSEAAR